MFPRFVNERVAPLRPRSASRVEENVIEVTPGMFTDTPEAVALAVSGPES